MDKYNSSFERVISKIRSSKLLFHLWNLFLMKKTTPRWHRSAVDVRRKVSRRYLNCVPWTETKCIRKNVVLYVCMYVEGVGQKSGPCTVTFNERMLYYTSKQLSKVNFTFLCTQWDRRKLKLWRKAGWTRRMTVTLVSVDVRLCLIRCSALLL
jgi:hypothetical protein